MTASVEGLRVVRIDDPETGPRFRVKEQAGYYVEVIPQLVNWRVHIVKVDGGPMAWSHRFWCYEGRGTDTFVAATLAAHAWEVAEDTEPVGWVKSWDGRRNGEGPCVVQRSGDPQAEVLAMWAALGIDLTRAAE